MRKTFIVGIVLMAAGSGLGAQDQLRAAKDLYASAAYEDALTTLSHVDGGSTEVTREVDQYRAFSLFALGRTREAESVAEAMIRKDPLARLNSVDASPRLEQMFTDVRKRLLPSLIRERFRSARGALDDKSFDSAKPQLTEARLMIADAEKLGVKDDGLGDLSVLIDGFLQLIRFESEKRPSPPPAVAANSGGASVQAITPPATALPPAARATPPPVVTPPGPAPVSGPAARPAAPESVGSAHVYSIDDEGVSPPVAIDQRMPAISGPMGVVIKRLHSNGLVDILIDESGRVVDATIRRSLNSSFDAMVVQSARRWKYQPAMKDGVPVRYVKTLLLVP
jgi:TonB family protein